MSANKLIPILGLSVLSAFSAVAQESRAERRKNKDKNADQEVKTGIESDSLLVPIPNNRWLFADKVAKGIRAIDAKDGSVDGIVHNEDETRSRLLTQAYITGPARMRNIIENSPATHAQKIGYHRALAEKLENFRRNNREDIDAVYHRQMMQNFHEMLLADIDGKVLDFAKANADLYSLENIESFDGNGEAKAFLYKSVGMQYPVMMMERLDKIAREPYADEIVTAAAKVAPRSVMTYADPNSKYRYIINRNQDKTVKAIVSIVDNSQSRFKVLQFLNQIKDGDKTIAEIDKMVQNDDSYYRSLVALKISGKAISETEIEKELADRSLIYIRKVNELHDASDAVRFRSIEGFEPEEYYFMLLGGETNEIYTSSYLGIFKRMMAKLGNESGYALLEKVRMSNFRTFVRMAAGYNTISPFLQTMSEQEKNTLLRNFVAGLEKGGRSDLKDAVDVADAFGSLVDKDLLAFLKKEVETNYERVFADKKLKGSEQKKGVIVYGLLASIFNSSANPEQLQGAVDNIPPINFVDINSLKNDSGEVVAQAFFYGDQDGKDSYGYFMSSFRNKSWKIDDSNPNWVKIMSTGDKAVTYYANKPLPEPQDEVAQNKLYEYLDANEIKPVVVIHRGHSYHLDGSLKNLTPAVKIVMLGSCGGFHNLANVLDKAPDANIISTKQIGSYMINDPIIRSINEYLLTGKNVDWLDMWSGLGKSFATKSAREKELFSDYIPPNRNLGAIFIKAYRKIEMTNQS